MRRIQIAAAIAVVVVAILAATRPRFLRNLTSWIPPSAKWNALELRTGGNGRLPSAKICWATVESATDAEILGPPCPELKQFQSRSAESGSPFQSTMVVYSPDHPWRGLPPMYGSQAVAVIENGEVSCIEYFFNGSAWRVFDYEIEFEERPHACKIARSPGP